MISILQTVFALVLGIMIPSLPADDARDLTRAFPCEYVGTFRWQVNVHTQHVRFAFNSVAAVGDGTFVSNGDGRYETANRVTKIKLKMLIFPKDLAVRIFLSDPDQQGFLTSGVHEGRLSSDFRTIDATWRTEGDDCEKGYLQLRAK